MTCISVCVPTYNMGRYLGAAIESVLAQDDADFDLQICDDSSTDDTPSVVDRIRDRRLTYTRFEERAGQAGNFNRCLHAARGDYMTILHADDLLLPGFLANRQRRLELDASLAFVFGSVQVIDAAGQVVRVSAPWEEDRCFSSREMVAALLLECAVSPPSLMMRRVNALATGPFRDDLTWGHDWEWTLRLASTGGAAYVAAPMAAYRVHDGSGTADMLRAARNGGQERSILDAALDRLIASGECSPTWRRRSLKKLGQRHLYYAHLALLRDQPAVARYNLRWAVSADAMLAVRPTVWLLLLASMGVRSPYQRWATVRGIGVTT